MSFNLRSLFDFKITFQNNNLNKNVRAVKSDINDAAGSHLNAKFLYIFLC